MKISNIDLDRIIAYISRSQLSRHRACLLTLHTLLFLMRPQGRKRHWWCRPSVSSLAELVCRTRRQVHMHLNILEDAGFIRRRRRAKNGYRLSNLYTPGPSLIAIIDHLKKEEAKNGRSR
jgi:DNA-binding MarR family transcriptional regulator